jgi:hypothetical protein
MRLQRTREPVIVINVTIGCRVEGGRPMPDKPVLKEFTPGVERALGAATAGASVQALLERTLGHALLEKMQGRPSDLPAIYQAFGGADPGVASMLKDVNATFQKLPLKAGVAVAQKAAPNAVAAAKGGGKSMNAMLARVQGQALHTLSSFGGAVGQ